MITDRHAELLRQLQVADHPTWGERVLLTALADLALSLADRETFGIVDAWADADDAVRFVYRPSWGDDTSVGLLRVRRDAPLPYYLYEDEDTQTPEEYGENIALLDLGPPLGRTRTRLVFDDEGIGWWGDGYTDPLE